MNLNTKLRFVPEGTDRSILVSYSEEILGHFGSEGKTLQINVGTVLNILGDEYKVTGIQTSINQKADKVYGMTMAEQVGESFPESVTVTYLIKEVTK